MVWTSGDADPKTGETVTVPWLHTDIAVLTTTWVVAPGGMNWMAVAISHEVSPATVTSEYPRLKYAVPPAGSITDDEEKFVKE